MMYAILSLSLLTVMAGAAVAPALGKLQEHFAAPALFCAGYLIMAFAPNAVMSVAGSFMVGFANGAGIPCIIAAASHKAGKEAVSTVMPLLSAAMYIAQFVSPFIMSFVTKIAGGADIDHLPFIWAVILAVILAMFAVCIKSSEEIKNNSFS